MEEIVISRDWISALPNDLLINILYFVSTKDAVATMTLSKRWRFLWTMVPKLEYEDTGDDCERICRFLDKSLELHNAPVLETLFIQLGKNCPIGVDVNKWVSSAVDRFVRKLESGNLWTTEPTSLPDSLYTCRTLVELTLSGKIVVDVPSSACLPSLKTLRLLFVVYKDGDSFARLLSSCSVLSRSILRIGLSDCWKKHIPMRENLPFAKPHIFLLCYPHDKILTSFSLVTHLSLTLRDTMAVNFTGITFSLLRWLTLTPYGHLWMDLLLLVLNISPKLRFLKIQYVFPYRPGSLPLSWKKPSYVPKCLSSSLEIFLWEKYRGSEEDKQLTRYILANSNCLKKAKIIFTSTFLLEEKETMEKELEAMPRVSMMSQLLCE